MMSFMNFFLYLTASFQTLDTASTSYAFTCKTGIPNDFTISVQYLPDRVSKSVAVNPS